MSAPVLPENLLRRMRPEDRASLGKAGLLASECREIAVAKSEKHLQQQIEAMLRRNGIYVIRQRMDKRTSCGVGCPDLLFSVGGDVSRPGVPVAWEVKMPGQKPRPEQLQALEQMAGNGWRTAIVTSYAQALGLFNALLASTTPPPARARLS